MCSVLSEIMLAVPAEVYHLGCTCAKINLQYIDGKKNPPTQDSLHDPYLLLSALIRESACLCVVMIIHALLSKQDNCR